VAGILITGASGYLGSELARQRPAHGTWLHAPPPTDLTGATQVDVRDEPALAALVRELEPEAVIHTAYRESGDEAAAVNVDGSRWVARAAAAVGARLVHVSTDLVFSGELGRPYAESDEPLPVMEYGRQKLAAERAVREELPGALVVRTSLIYGGREPSRHEQLALDAADGKLEISFFADELRSPVQVGDLAAALLELADSPATGVLHVAGADGVDRYEFANLVAVANGRDPAKLRRGLLADHPDPRPPDCRLDSTRAQEMIRTPLRGAGEVLLP